MEEELQKMLESLTHLTEAGKVLSAVNRKLVEDMMAGAKKLDYHPMGKQIAEICQKLLDAADGESMQEADGATLAEICEGLTRLTERQFTVEERKAMAEKGMAMPDGSYPIQTKADLSNAIQSFGRAKNQAEVKQHIMARAKAMGMMDMLPEDWMAGMQEECDPQAGKGKKKGALKEAKGGLPDDSLEDRMNEVRAALDKKYGTKNQWGGYDNPYYIIATYADRVIARFRDDQETYEIPFTINASDEISFEAPAKVAIQYVRESVQIIEAVKDSEGKASGREWDVILIEAGQSKNGKYYPAETLKAAAPLFEGVYAYADHATDAERAARPERSVKDKVGRYSDVQFGKFKVGGKLVEGLKARFKVIQPWLRETLKEAVDMGEPDFIGFSIDASGKVAKKLQGGKMVDWVEAITKVHSVDVVTTPAAGGRVVRLVASDGRKEIDMDPEELKKLMEGAAAAAVAPLQAEIAALKEAKPADADAAVKQQLEALAAKVRLQEAGGRVEAALKEATGLSDLGKERIRREFTELSERRDWTPEELSARIKESMDYEAGVAAQFMRPGIVASRFVQGDSGHDKLFKALTGLMDGSDVDGIPRFRSLKEAYCRWTGQDYFDLSASEYAQAFATNYASNRDHGRLKESLTTATWGQVFADVLYNRLMRAYAANPLYSSWRQFVSEIEDVPDFRDQHLTRIGGYSDLAAVAEGATYDMLTTGTDEEVKYAVSKRGGIDDLTWESIMNDRIGAVRKIPDLLGTAAARTLWKFVLNMITTDNPTMDYDSTALYHANHGANLQTDALSVSAVVTGTQRMRDQVEYGGSGEPLGERNKPKFLIVANELEALANRIVNPSDAYLATVSNAGTDVTHDPAAMKGKLEAYVYDVLTSATNWFMVADPAVMNTMVVGFLNGRQEPELFVQDQPNVGSNFTADKVSYKVRHVFGGDILEHRAFYRGNA